MPIWSNPSTPTTGSNPMPKSRSYNWRTTFWTRSRNRPCAWRSTEAARRWMSGICRLFWQKTLGLSSRGLDCLSFVPSRGPRLPASLPPQANPAANGVPRPWIPRDPPAKRLTQVGELRCRHNNSKSLKYNFEKGLLLMFRSITAIKTQWRILTLL